MKHAAIQAMKEIQSLQETEIIQLVDAKKMLLILSINKRLFTTLKSYNINNAHAVIYQKQIRNKLDYSLQEEKRSTQGITPSDPLAMVMYALVISPLIQKLRINEPNVKQVCFTDDSTAAGKVKVVRKW